MLEDRQKNYADSPLANKGSIAIRPYIVHHASSLFPLASVGKTEGLKE